MKLSLSMREFFERGLMSSLHLTSSRSKTFRAAAVFTTLFLSGAMAQEFRATLVGRVVDPSSAAISGANVTATELSTNTTRRAVTTETGDFTIPFLSPGQYRLEVEQTGFRKFVRDGISLRVQDRVSVDVTLQLGAQAESVTVTGETPLLETASASAGQVVSEQTVQDLPLNGRNAFALMTSTTGVMLTVKDPTISFMRYSAAGDTAGIASMSISGAPNTANEYLLDGVPITSDNAAVDYVPSIEATQEFRLQTNAFDAEFGRFLGGVVNSSIRSGTNLVHGTAFDFMRNSVWNARDFFATSKPQFGYNQFGVALGGPAFIPHLYNGKNRTFFYFLYDGSREGVPRSSVATVPTALERAGDFSQTFTRVSGQATPIIMYDPDSTRLSGSAYVRDAFPGNIIPANRQNQVGKALLNFFPLPSATGDAVTHVNNYPLSYKDPVLDNGVVFRVDHQFSTRNQLYLRYFWRHFAVRGGGTYMTTDPSKASTTGHVNRNTPGAALGYTFTVNPSTVLDLRYGYSRYSAVIISDSYGFDITSLGWPSSLARSIDVPVIPALTASGYTGYGSYSLAKSAGDTHFAHIGLSKQKHGHALRAGMDMRLYRHNSGPGGATPGTYNFDTAWTRGPNPQVTSATAGNSVGSLLLGLGASGSISYLASLARQAPYYELYFQDDIRLTGKLTVNLGIRYEWEGGMTERYNRINRGMDLAAASPIERQVLANYAQSPIPEVPPSSFRVKGGFLFAGQGGIGRALTDIDRNSVSPRLGFAYSLTPKTVLRGGYGHFFGSTLTQYYPGQACASCDVTPSYGNTATTTWVTAVGLTPVNTLSNPFPSGVSLPAGSSLGLMTEVGQGVGFVNPQQQQPWSQQFQFGIQRQIPRNVVLEAAYSGSRTNDHPVSVAIDALPRNAQIAARQTFIDTKKNVLSDAVTNPFYGLIARGSLSLATTTRNQLLLPYPQFTSINQMGQNIGSLKYDSFQFKANKRFAQGLSFVASYTLSKLLSQTSFLNANDAELTRALASWDAPQRFVLTGSYELPFGKGKKLVPNARGAVAKLVQGWQANVVYTAQSGNPITVGGGESTGKSAYLPNDQRTRYRWFDSSVFRLRETLEFVGTSVLPDVRTQGLDNVDLSFFKDTQIYERLKLQFRAEAFNLMNRVAFGTPGATVGSTSMGLISSQVNYSRQLQFALKFIW